MNLWVTKDDKNVSLSADDEMLDYLLEALAASYATKAPVTIPTDCVTIEQNGESSKPLAVETERPPTEYVTYKRLMAWLAFGNGTYHVDGNVYTSYTVCSCNLEDKVPERARIQWWNDHLLRKPTLANMTAAVFGWRGIECIG